jgi:hypothetical protein
VAPKDMAEETGAKLKKPRKNPNSITKPKTSKPRQPELASKRKPGRPKKMSSEVVETKEDVSQRTLSSKEEIHVGSIKEVEVEPSPIIKVEPYVPQLEKHKGRGKKRDKSESGADKIMAVIDSNN